MTWDATSYAVTGVAVRWRVKDTDQNEAGNQPGPWIPSVNGAGATAAQRNSRSVPIRPWACGGCDHLTNGVTYEVNAAFNTATDGTGWVSAGDGTPQSSGPAAPTFDPANGATETDASTNITLTFAEAIKADDMATPTDFTSTSLKTVLTLKQTNSAGTDIPFSASINSAKTIITINPTSDLENGDVYVAISDSWYDADGNQGSETSATFTVAASTGPAAPTNLIVTPGDGQLTLSWTGAAGATGYYVAYKESAAGGGYNSVSDSEITQLTWTITGLTNGTTYSLRVAAYHPNNLFSSYLEGSGTPNPPPTVSLSASPNPVPEGSAVTVTATLSRALSSNVTIPLTLTDNTAESTDHGTLSSITISAGSTTGTGTISTNHDTDEDDETFTVALGTLPSPLVAGTRSSVTVTIRDDEGTPRVVLLVSPNPVPEGSPVSVEACLRRGTSNLSAVPQGRAYIPVILSHGSSEDGDWGKLNARGRPLHTTHHIGISGAHQRSCGLISIPTNPDGDTLDDTFTVTLGTLPSGLLAGSPSSVTITIRDDGIAHRNDGVEYTVPPRQPPPSTGGGGGGGLPPPSSGDEPPPEDEEPSTSCPREDREILGSFYEMTGGEGWDRDDYWRNSEEPLEEWFGVGTDEDGRVISLLLPDNGLSGEMPEEELLCLSELVELALWGNDELSGRVPDELALPVERAALREIAETLDLNLEWFEEDYEDPFDFEDWYAGVTTDDEGRVTELDLPGVVPETIRSQFRRLRMITTSSGGGGCALSPEDDSFAFGLFLLTLVVFAALGRRRARG